MGVALLSVGVTVGVFRYTMQPKCWLEKRGFWLVGTNIPVLSEHWTSILIR
jgi:hypothetical protein